MSQPNPSAELEELIAERDELKNQLLDARAKLALAAEDAAGLEEWKRDQIDAYVELESEAFKLAAGQCIVDGGLVGDEYGHQFCSVKENLRIYKEQSDETRAQAIRETVERCMEICYKRGDTYALAGQQRSAAVCDVCAKDISADFLSKEDGK